MKSSLIHNLILFGKILPFLVAFILLFYYARQVQEWSITFIPSPAKTVGSEASGLSKLEKEIGDKEKKLAQYTPNTPYLIINTAKNEFSLFSGKKLIRKGICSTGSYTVLKVVDKEKQWVFKTPIGVHRVLSKVTNPVWHK